ncbi:SMEK domain-containing protein [Citrobacter youngae]|uniref:SMEK domain-containing protein n=1 Tax=Citrobacter youngae ATCC 29220 TaxID=500640 RepID=D4BB05_9ENTR|nr:SMEK domain-containing protein [Citrobacter youngae]EFE09366.1 hypothetical protein CIT292_07652 [Citrobacter youngae ATCC 29220]
MEIINVENELRDVISRIQSQVKLSTKQNRYDINLALEDAFIPVLKEVFQLPHLFNLNSQQKNFPGIDLGDQYDRVAFQITSSTGLEKVKKTLSQFIEKRFYESFDELYILTLVEKQSSYSQESIDKITGSQFSFNTRSHVIDLGDLLSRITSMRITAQKRVLHEFRLILGEVDSFLQFTEAEEREPQILTTNISCLKLPENLYVADVNVDFDDVLKRARTDLGFTRKKYSRPLLMKFALLFAGFENPAWVYYEGRLFSFINMANEPGLLSVIDEGTLETLNTADLSESDYVENHNILRMLITNTLIRQLDIVSLSFSQEERSFYFQPLNEGDKIRQEIWVGKQKATRTVYECKENSREAGKILYHKHLSFRLSFVYMNANWYGLIIPDWLFTYNLYKKSHKFHERELKKQKKLERASSVRNLTRFIAYFLTNNTADSGIHFSALEQLECFYPDIVEGSNDLTKENNDESDDIK